MGGEKIKNRQKKLMKVNPQNSYLKNELPINFNEN